MSSLRKSLILVLLSAGVSCAHRADRADRADRDDAAATARKPTSIEAKQVAAEEEAPYVTEFAFKKNDASLTPAARAKLAKLYKNAKAKGEIEDVRVITWADEEFPSVHTKTLPKAQQDLVDRRNAEIENYLESLDKDTDVKTYSMAKRPGLLADLLSTTDARIKKSLEVAGIPNTHTSVKRPSKASKSIVMFLLEE
jgi:hypothetical protein